MHKPDSTRQTYRPEIAGTLILAPIVLGIETWRRWDELLAPHSLDDWLIFGSAVIVAILLHRGQRHAVRLWGFVCGGAWFMMALSVWGSIYAYADGDPSGVPMPGVIAFKGVAFALISLAAYRALWFHPDRP